MKQLITFILGLFTLTISYSQDTLFLDSKYLMDLELSARNLKCDTITLTSTMQSQLITHCHLFGDTAVLKVETIYNYEASLKGSIYIRTEYYDTSKRLLAWTNKSFDSGILIAGEINYYDVNSRLLENLKWGSGEIGLRTKFFYDAKGNLVKEVIFRGNQVIKTKTL